MKLLYRSLALLALLALLAYACTFQVNAGEVATVLRFGNPEREVEPGLHFKLPAPIDVVVYIDRRVHVLDPGSAEFLTRDKKNVVVDSFLAWRVAEPRRFVVALGSMESAQTRLTDVLRSVTNEVVGVNDFAALISVRPGEKSIREIDAEITSRLRDEALAKFGIEVRIARIKRVAFPSQNKNSVYDRMRADRQSIARGIRSEGEEEYQKIQARTDRETAAMTAQAERKAAEIRGESDAEVQRVLAEAAAIDPELWRFLRDLELFEASFNERSTVILPAGHELLRGFASPNPDAPRAGTPPQAPAKGEQ
jgi:membrane protease subunit HflC